MSSRKTQHNFLTKKIVDTFTGLSPLLPINFHFGFPFIFTITRQHIRRLENLRTERMRKKSKYSQEIEQEIPWNPIIYPKRRNFLSLQSFSSQSLSPFPSVFHRKLSIGISDVAFLRFLFYDFAHSAFEWNTGCGGHRETYKRFLQIFQRKKSIAIHDINYSTYQFCKFKETLGVLHQLKLVTPLKNLNFWALFFKKNKEKLTKSRVA